MLAVDPTWAGGPRAGVPFEEDAAIMPLAGPAVLISALRSDAVGLRRALDRGLALLDMPMHTRDVDRAAQAPHVGAASR